MRESYTETVAKWVYRWWFLKVSFALFFFGLVFLATVIEVLTK